MRLALCAVRFASLALCSLRFACLFGRSSRQRYIKFESLETTSPTSRDSGLEVIRRKELRALGYFEGKNIAFEHRYTEGKLERSLALADELVRLKVDLIFADSTPGAQAAKTATGIIPIVFFTAGVIRLSLGFVDSLARPGGNITGFTTISPVIRRHATKATQGNYSQALSRCCAVGLPRTV